MQATAKRVMGVASGETQFLNSNSKTGVQDPPRPLSLKYLKIAFLFILLPNPHMFNDPMLSLNQNYLQKDNYRATFYVFIVFVYQFLW